MVDVTGILKIRLFLVRFVALQATFRLMRPNGLLYATTVANKGGYTRDIYNYQPVPNALRATTPRRKRFFPGLFICGPANFARLGDN